MTRWGSKHGIIGVSKFFETRAILTIFLIENREFLNYSLVLLTDAGQGCEINTKTHKLFHSEDFAKLHFWKLRKNVVIDSLFSDIWSWLSTSCKQLGINIIMLFVMNEKNKNVFFLLWTSIQRGSNFLLSLIKTNRKDLILSQFFRHLDEFRVFVIHTLVQLLFLGLRFSILVLDNNVWEFINALKSLN
jgi:hypothetical protein